MALLASLLINAIIRQRLIPAAIWLTIIVSIKPMWAFAAILPLLTGRRTFFFRMAVLALIGQFVIAVVVVSASDASYAGTQYIEYLRLLARMSNDFPWRGPEQGFLGYNHSIRQIVLFFVGLTPAAWKLATVAKWVLLAPLVVVILRALISQKPVERVCLLELAFVLYLGVFIWLDVVWEISLGIVVFVYTIATVRQRWLHVVIWCTFLPYALIDLWQLLSYAILGESAMLPGPYFVTDPSIYIPLVMLVTLVFYTVLIGRCLAYYHCSKNTPTMT
jgi:hypothetical protein